MYDLKASNNEYYSIFHIRKLYFKSVQESNCIKTVWKYTRLREKFPDWLEVSRLS